MSFILKLRSNSFSKNIFQTYPTNYRYYSSIKLNQILCEAENELGVKSSDFKVSNLLKGEFDLEIFAVNKLNSQYISESNHPIVKIGKTIFGSDPTQDKNNGIPMDDIRCLVLLLLGKVSQSLPSFKPNVMITKKQSDFVEINELINRALLIHSTAVIDIPLVDRPGVSEQARSKLKRLSQANNISILAANYMLGLAHIRLARLICDYSVLNLVMCAIGEFCIGHFKNLEERINEITIPSVNTTLDNWEELGDNTLTNLFAYSSQIMLLLAEQSDRYQKAAFDYGLNLQLILILKKQTEDLKDNNSLNLMSAPVVFHMNYDKHFHEYLSRCVRSNQLDLTEIRQMINKGPAIDECNRLLDYYTRKAIKSLDVFPESNPKSILKNAIFASNS